MLCLKFENDLKSEIWEQKYNITGGRGVDPKYKYDIVLQKSKYLCMS